LNLEISSLLRNTWSH